MCLSGDVNPANHVLHPVKPSVQSGFSVSGREGIYSLIVPHSESAASASVDGAWP